MGLRPAHAGASRRRQKDASRKSDKRAHGEDYPFMIPLCRAAPTSTWCSDGGGDGVATADSDAGGSQTAQHGPARQICQRNCISGICRMQKPVADGARGAEALPLTWGSHSRAGDDPIRSQRENQDAFIVEDCFCEDRYQLFAAVMDGHGPNGANVALFVRDQLAEACIERKKRLQEQPREVLLEAHAAVAAKLRGPENEIDQYVSGTSSLCVLVQPTCMWFANLGDCRAVIGQVRQPIRMRRGKEIKEPVNAELARERRAESRANKKPSKPDENILNEGLMPEANAADATTTAEITATKTTQGEATDETARNATSSTNTDASPMATKVMTVKLNFSARGRPLCWKRWK